MADDSAALKAEEPAMPSFLPWVRPLFAATALGESYHPIARFG